jgi:hypothetical protein
MSKTPAGWDFVRPEAIRVLTIKHFEVLKWDLIGRSPEDIAQLVNLPVRKVRAIQGAAAYQEKREEWLGVVAQSKREEFLDVYEELGRRAPKALTIYDNILRGEQVIEVTQEDGTVQEARIPINIGMQEKVATRILSTLSGERVHAANPFSGGRLTYEERVRSIRRGADGSTEVTERESVARSGEPSST